MKKKELTPSDKFNTAVEVRETPDKGKAVFAMRDIRLGEKFGYFAGSVTQTNDMHAIHLEGVLIKGIGKLQFLNHSCGPNSNFKNKNRWLYAKKDIHKGEEVTIDYTRTEKKFTSPFECKCGAPNCRKFIGMNP